MRRFSFLKKGIFWFWALNGIVISLLVTGMYATGSKSLTNSLKFGEVCEYMYGGFTYTNDTDNMKDVQLSNNAFGVDFNNKRGKWKYIYFNVNTDTDMEWSISFYTTGNKLLFQKNVTIEDGVNKLKLPGKSFSNVVISITSPEEILFTLKNAQIREKEKIELRAGHVVFFLISLLIYSGIVYAGSVIMRKRNIRFYKVIDVLQDIYIAVGNSLLWVSNRFTFRQKHLGRVGLLVFWQVAVMYLVNIKVFTSYVYYKYILAATILFIFVIAVSMLERPLERVSWNNKLVFYWFLLSVVMCISEYIIPKRYMLVGVIQLFVFGFLYFLWNHMKDQKLFIRELILSLKGTFVIFSVFSICFRPLYVGSSYMGPAHNPNSFSTHLVPVILALLVELEGLFEEKRKKQICLDIVLLLMALSFVYMTHSSAGVLLSIVVIMMFARHLWLHMLKEKRLLNIGLTFIIVFVILIPMYMTLQWAISHVPPAIGKEVEFPADIYKISEQAPMAQVEAAEKETIVESVFYSPVVTKFFNMRNVYWSGYIRDVNVVGHEDQAVLWGRISASPHNSMLAIVYRYGIFAIAPYVFMMLSALYCSFKKYNYEKGSKKYSFFIFGMCVVMIGFSLIENTETPLRLTEWIIFYFMLGYLFSSDREDVIRDER